MINLNLKQNRYNNLTVLAISILLCPFQIKVLLKNSLRHLLLAFSLYPLVIYFDLGPFHVVVLSGADSWLWKCSILVFREEAGQHCQILLNAQSLCHLIWRCIICVLESIAKQLIHQLRLLDEVSVLSKHFGNLAEVVVFDFHVEVLWHEVGEEILAEHKGYLVWSVILNIFNSVHLFMYNSIAVYGKEEINMTFQLIIYRISPLMWLIFRHYNLLEPSTFHTFIQHGNKPWYSSHSWDEVEVVGFSWQGKDAFVEVLFNIFFSLLTFLFSSLAHEVFY